ncbi:nardilysin-like [Bacillus rossius redtenbacheri]|uniref:nardilysin-like n=1 Tax=Bacillus rossius redtenbacheri TaxID=93214 RepID=UPI002FDF0117
MQVLSILSSKIRINWKLCSQLRFNCCQGTLANQSPLFLDLKYKLNFRVKMRTPLPSQVNVQVRQIFGAPRKSLFDEKEYKVLKLENDLTVLLISDVENLVSLSGDSDSSNGDSTDSSESSSESDDDEDDSASSSDSSQSSSEEEAEEKLAAVGLCVGVGSFNDPPNILGMAHFLEHMVFMGSKKYSEENDFDAFLTHRGGSSNASTDYAHTTFNFECQEKHLEKAMDRFSQFFIAPLMRKEAMQREREAIESEFQIELPIDGNRREQILCSLAKQGHPVNKFSWGNLKTLRDGVSDDQLYAEAHKFHEKHYSAHHMTLAVQARLPLSTLEEWVVKYFSAIPNNKLPPDDFKPFSDGISFDTPEFTKLYKVESVKDINKLYITWALPSFVHMYRSKPHQVISSALGYEGKGSLISYLRKKVWALDLEAGNSEDDFEHNSMYCLFNISIGLTTEGAKHIPQVVEAVFGYLQLMKQSGPNERFFEEIRLIAEIGFLNEDEASAWDFTEELCENMHFYPPEEYIAGPYLFYEYDPQAITDCLARLSPDKINVMIFRRDDDVVYDRTEPWFNTSYNVSDVPEEWLSAWRDAALDPGFFLPPPNVFLPTRFDRLPLAGPAPPHPVKVRDDVTMEVWHKQDTKFKQPTAYYCFNFISPLMMESVHNWVMFDLYCSLLNQQVAEACYPAIAAHLQYSIRVGDTGIIVMVNGFNDKLQLLLKTIVEHMSRFEENLTQEMFDALKEHEKRSYYNSFMKPKRLVRDLRLAILLQKHWTYVDKHAAYEKIDVDMLKDLSRQILQHLYVQCLIQGNVTKEEALSACDAVVKTLKCGPPLPSTLPQIKVLKIPEGEHFCRISSFNHQDPNSFIINYYQSGPGTIKSSCILELIVKLMEEPVFNTLRTKEQLGYDVCCEVRDTYGILGFTVAVNSQADKHSVDHVDERIEAFLKRFVNMLRDLSSSDLEEVRHSLINLKQCRDLHLKEEVGRNWQEILNNTYLFDRMSREVKALETISLEELQKWLKDHISSSSSSNFRKLSVQVVGHTTPDKDSGGRDSDESHARVHRHARVHGSPRINRRRPSQLQMHNAHAVDFSLKFITTSDKKSPESFISDIGIFKDKLTIYPHNKIVD